MATSSLDVPNTELIARAVIIRDQHILAARQRGKKWFFLPGGHVESGETVEQALARELDEELGTSANATRFAGAVEHAYNEDGFLHRELNIIFTVTADLAAVHSQEAHLEFVPLGQADLAHTDLRPAALKDALMEWFTNQEPFWRGCQE